MEGPELFLQVVFPMLCHDNESKIERWKGGIPIRNLEAQTWGGRTHKARMLYMWGT